MPAAIIFFALLFYSEYHLNPHSHQRLSVFFIMDPFQTLHIPKPAVVEAHDLLKMDAMITSYPPLGQITVISGTTTTFTVLLETTQSRASNNWEVSLWYSYGEEWQESPLKSNLESSDNLPSMIQTFNGSPPYRLYFAADVEITSHMVFTIKFRSGPHQPWKWVKDEQGSFDGNILSKSKIPMIKSEILGDYVKDLNPKLESRNVISQSPGTVVWSVTAPIDAANGEKSAIADLKFGLPWAGKLLRYVHNVTL